MKSVIVLTAAVLAACAAPQPPRQLAAPPADYESVVNAYLHTVLFDPYSIQELKITAPEQVRTPLHLDDGTSAAGGWMSCVSYNAKNRMGGYTGLKHHIIAYDGPSVVWSDDEGMPGPC